MNGKKQRNKVITWGKMMKHWIRILYSRFGTADGETVGLYDYICPVCGYKTGNQAKEFRYCPMCGERIKDNG